ncbi:hypothetical protein OG21DRAFT_1489221 [Imleria badia]|nr:hypothetical protein OG21DRAFT_1489221 [Imleria badia]
MASIATGLVPALLSSPPSVEPSPAAAMPPPSPGTISADATEISHSLASPPLSVEPNVSGSTTRSPPCTLPRAPHSLPASPMPCAAAVPHKKQAGPDSEPEELPTTPTILSPFLAGSSILPAPGQASQQVEVDEQIPSAQGTLAALQGYESGSLDGRMEVDDENKPMEE